MSDSVKKILDLISELNLVEASELVKAIEEKFDVSASAPAAVAMAPAGGAAAGGEAAEEKTEFDVILESFDDGKKIAVIKAVKTITGKGLGEAKAVLEELPATLKTGVAKDEAEKLKEELVAAGAGVKVS